MWASSGSPGPRLHAAIPAAGKAFFYAVQFFDSIQNSSYGSEDVGRARVVNGGDCP